MSRSRHITKRPLQDAEWFKRKVAELGESLKQLPEDRRQQLQREVDHIQPEQHDQRAESIDQSK